MPMANASSLTPGCAGTIYRCSPNTDMLCEPPLAAGEVVNRWNQSPDVPYFRCGRWVMKLASRAHMAVIGAARLSCPKRGREE
jgi:hypothetical protein